jgi:hypothetical protein
VDEKQIATMSEALLAMAAQATTQQDAAQLLLDRAKQEAAASAALRAMAADAVAGMKTAAGEMKKATEEGVTGAATRAFAGAGDAIARGAGAVCQPVMARFEGAVAAAGEAEGKLRELVRWASWRLVTRGAVLLVVGVFAAWLLGVATVWQRQREVDDLVAERQALTGEIEALREQAARIRVVDCESKGGPKARKCIAVNVRGLYGDPKADVLYYPVW